MAEVHQLILLHGVEEARRQAVTKHERALVDTAFQVLSDDAEKMGFTYSGFALTSLPHKPQSETVWRREGHNLTMLMESGRDRAGKPIGLPYGSYARFILLFLQSEAIRTSSREVELGRSMRVWLGSMGLSIGGTTYKMVNQQAARISGCSLTFFADRAGAQIKSRGGFVKTEISMTATLSDQPSLWQDRVLLDEDFYRALREHPVPVSEAALRAIGARSMVLDVYIWLAYRLHVLTQDTSITWLSLHAQFGAAFSRLRRFREHFLECLAIALAAYPDARVTATEEGLILHPSRPAVRKLPRP
ncbi:replication protein RepA [Muricoccus radiodurans]|uniref:replication protein RepA n=1 Tax=Muricoccus radiodurans TaxID=2231721 RepID=UPI003CFBBCC4